LKDNISLILALLVIFISAAFIYFTGGAPIKKGTAGPTEKPTNESEASLPESEEEALKSAVKQAIVEKNNLDSNDLMVTVRTVEGDYATGGAGSVTPGPGGGVWFAAKVNGQWKLVWDGNGAIYCSDLKDYSDFPTSLIPECYDEGMGEMVPR
jgi:hypothetical protein